MRQILKYLKPCKKQMLYGFICKTIGTAAELFLPFLLSYILEKVIITLDIKKIIFYGVIMLLCSAVACVGNIVANRSASKVATTFSLAMRKELFEKTLFLSAKNTDKFTIPSLEARITSDTYNVHNFIGMMQRMGVRAPILLLGGIIITLFMDVRLSLVMIATLPLIFVVVYTVSIKGIPLYERVQKKVDGMIRVAREDVQGIRVIKALSKNDYENRRYDKVNQALANEEKRAGVLMSTVNPFMTLLMNLGIAGVVAVAAYQVKLGNSSSATVIAFMQYFTLISMAMMSLSRMFVMYTKCAASAKRIMEVVNTPDSFDTIEKTEINETPHIVFEKVNFSYLGKKDNLHNINIKVNKNGSLGIIGATGSGKSTLIKLLIRFYDVDSGEIRINGVNLKTYTKEELSSMFGVALQSDFIYAETIEENIRFGRDISDDAIIRAAKIAQAHDFITAFPEGYNHLLASKGTNISGGQRQRILIARAIAANPEILILDDSSSALDYKTDATLRKTLSKELKNTTVIMVAQRISSVKNCDTIVVLEEGEIIGIGTHDELLQNCASYRGISESQMGGAFVD